MLLNEEQQALADTLASLFDELSPATRARELRDERSEQGYDVALWQQLCEMGLPCAVADERNGGFGFGYLGMGAAFIEGGRRLVSSPLLSVSILSTGLLEALASTEQQSELLGPILSGEKVMTLAHDESPHYPGLELHTRVTATDGGWCISGRKSMVTDGHVADTLLVSARPDEGDCVVLMVDANAPGVVVERRFLIDGRNYADISFDNVTVPANARLADSSDCTVALSNVLDRATICTSAEMLGLAEAVFEKTIEYLKVRKQFGVAIGSFQALQHRCAKLFVELQMLRSVVLDALQAIDDNRRDLPIVASQAKSMANTAVESVTNEAVQLHGGIGVTDELDIGLFLKRGRVCRRQFGDTAFHNDRYARLSGF